MAIYKRNKSMTNAEYVQLALKEQKEQERQRVWQEQAIDLYPKDLREGNFMYAQHERRKALEESSRRFSAFREQVQKELLFHALANIMQPISESMAMNSHQNEVMGNAIYDFVQEQDMSKLLTDFKYKNIYLAEIAQKIEEYTDLIYESAKDKIKEGLSFKDVFAIENEKLQNFITDTNGIVPENFNNKVFDRVETAVTDFIDDNRKNKAEIREIYDKAKQKIMDAEEDPTLDDDDLDDDDLLDGDDDDDDYGDDMGEGEEDDEQYEEEEPPKQKLTTRQQIQQEAVRTARHKEAEIAQRAKGVFGEMVTLVTESAHTSKPIQEIYTSHETNRIDFAKLIGDVKAVYTFLEAMNTTGIIDADGNFINKTLFDLKSDLNPSNGEQSIPKELDSVMIPDTNSQLDDYEEKRGTADDIPYVNAINPKGYNHGVNIMENAIQPPTMKK